MYVEYTVKVRHLKKMAFHVKAKKPWKTLDIESAGFSQKDLEGLISLQELTDYEIVDSKLKKQAKVEKYSRKRKAPTPRAAPVSKKTLFEVSEALLQLKDTKDNLVQNTNSDEEYQKIQNIPIEKDQNKQKKKLKSETDSDQKGTTQSKNKRDKKVLKQGNTVERELERLGNVNKKGIKVQMDKKGKQKKNKKKSVNKAVVEGKGQTVENINELMEAESAEMNKRENMQNKKRNKRKNRDESAVPKKKVKLETWNETPAAETDGKHTESTNKSLKGMDAWKDLFVPEEVLWALKGQGFTEPTPIQRQILPSAIRDQMDVVGAAETGSGKTLAFGIPLLHFILQQKRMEAEKLLHASEDEGVETDIADDTDAEEDDDMEEDEGDTDKESEDTGMAQNDEDNEVTDDDNDVDDDNGVDDDDDSDEDEDEDEAKTESNDDEIEGSSEEELEDLEQEGIGCVKVIKDVDFSWLQETEVKKREVTHPRALILEPTRELAIQVRNHLQAAAKYTDVTVAAIVGGLAMPKQQRILKKCPDILVATPGRLWELIQQGEVYLSEIEKTSHLVVDEADRMIEKGHYEELAKLLEKMKRDPDRENRHTYVFSATLTLLHSGPHRAMKKKKKQWDEKQKLAHLMKTMGLKPKPKVVDITRKVGTVETLTEARINCTKEEKDIYLYYFLKHYPGRTLVFTNSKDCIRRLVSIFTLLQCNPLPLHADMHQRQRLKNLDKFTGNPSSLLIASDVAARGLDIPNVQHVIHYQVPHTVENYVHRSGRTARASKEGLSIVLIGPDDVKDYRKVIHTLNKSEDLPLFPVESQLLPEIRRRVNMVRDIETQEYRFKKSKRQNDWFRKAADEIGVDIEDEGLLDDLGDDSEQQGHHRYIKQMKSELAILLKQPLLTGSSFTKYPTMSGKLLTPPTTTDTKGDALTQVKAQTKLHKERLGSKMIKQNQTKRRRERRKNKKKKNKEKAEVDNE